MADTIIPLYNPSKFQSGLNTFQEIFSDPSVDEFHGNVILPLDFSLEIDGLSGIIPNSAFEIPVENLPNSYHVETGGDKGKSRIAFILHSINQNFDNNKWTTKLTGQTLNIRFDELTEAEKAQIEKFKKDHQTVEGQIQNTARSIAPPKFNGSRAKNREAAYNALEIAYPGFKNKLRQVAASIGSNEADLVRVMYAESGLNPASINSIGCVGLIQFCHDKKGVNYKTINGVQYDLTKIRFMSGVQQLDVVEKYYKALGFNSNKKVDIADLYGATFLPIFVGKPLDWVARAKGLSAESITKSNKGIAKFSTRSDGLIDKAAFLRYVNSIL